MTEFKNFPSELVYLCALSFDGLSFDAKGAKPSPRHPSLEYGGYVTAHAPWKNGALT
jgi:hypothetical protein